VICPPCGTAVDERQRVLPWRELVRTRLRTAVETAYAVGMRAVVMRRSALVVDTVPDPTPGAGDVLVRTLACGICGSDLHALRHGDEVVAATRDMGVAKVMDLGRDVVMGHEFAAEVVDYGPGTPRTYAPGMPVCSVPLVMRPDGVETVGFSNEIPGGYGEFMVLSRDLLLPIPNGLLPQLAALTEPLAVGVHAVGLGAMTPHDVPLVIGCGPIGLAVIAALKLRGAAPIVVADFSPARRALARTMGADVVVDPATTSPYTSWEGVAVARTEAEAAPANVLVPREKPLRPAVIFECVGVPGVIEQIVRGAPSYARVVVVGVCMERDAFRPFLALGKELSLRFSFYYTPEEYAQTLTALGEGRIDASPLVTGKVGLDGVAEAFRELATPERHAKILITP
jgi:threonine dehydrogenase-like Zn-dependent dehydrogenase